MLKLVGYFIENIKLSADIPSQQLLSTEPQKLNTSVTPQFFKSGTDAKKFKISLLTKLDIEEYEFSLELKITGLFVIDDESETALINEKAPSILLNTVRDIVYSLSAKTVYGPICVPFCELSEIKKED